MTEKKQNKPKEERILIQDLNMYQKIHLAIERCADVKKKQTGMGYSAGSYNDVQQVVKEACLYARLVLTPSCFFEVTDDKLMIATITLNLTDIDNPFKDENGRTLHHTHRCGDIKVPQVLKGNQNDPKVSGSLISYGYKYLLQKFFLLNIEESQDLDFEQTKSSSTDGFDLNKLK